MSEIESKENCAKCGHAPPNVVVILDSYPAPRRRRRKQSAARNVTTQDESTSLEQRRDDSQDTLVPSNVSLPNLLFGLERTSFYLGLSGHRRQQVCAECLTTVRRRTRLSLALRALLKLITYIGAGGVCACLVERTAPAVDHWRDTAILTAAWVIALAHLFLAYEKGGRVWVIRHGMITDGVKTVDATVGGMPGLVAIASIWRLAPKPGVTRDAVPRQTRTEPDDAPSVVPAEPARPFYRSWILRRSYGDTSRTRSAAPALVKPDTARAETPADAPTSPATVRQDRLWRRCLSGFWGEAVIVTAAIIVCMIIVWQCSLANLIYVLRAYPTCMLALAVFVAVVVADYSFRQVQHAIGAGRSDAYCGAMLDAYEDYAVYSWFLFAFGALILGLLLAEFLLHKSYFATERSQIVGWLQHAAALTTKAKAAHTPEAAVGYYRHSMTYVELAYGRLSGVDATLQDQINPVLIFAALLILLNILISHTDLKHLFADDARIYTMVFTYAPMALVGIAGLEIYFSSYHALMSNMIDALKSATPDAGIVDPDLIKRHDEIAAEVLRGSNIFGFAAAVGGVGSGAPLFLAFIKEILDRVGNREAFVEAGAELFRRPHPRFRPSAHEAEHVVFERARRNTASMRKAHPEADA